ncbi:hypothetical protein [Thalassospira mesophila]|uniref:hypothetical protein n=1 Tax=Thalassospira mesophila TaxID=1293891 RepID=UPI00117D3DEE|nr:hypothetical protein [Thalassospira mesophila]
MTENLLYRQVHPTHYMNGLSSGAFRPTPSDQDQLSVDCSSLTTPQLAFELHQKKTKEGPNGERIPLESAGTWGFSRYICVENGLIVKSDPISGEEHQPDNQAHHLVDFSNIPGDLKKNKNRNVAKKLRNDANSIGCLYPVEKL